MFIGFNKLYKDTSNSIILIAGLVILILGLLLWGDITSVSMGIIVISCMINYTTSIKNTYLRIDYYIAAKKSFGDGNFFGVLYDIKEFYAGIRVFCIELSIAIYDIALIMIIANAINYIMSHEFIVINCIVGVIGFVYPVASGIAIYKDLKMIKSISKHISYLYEYYDFDKNAKETENFNTSTSNNVENN